MDLHSQRWSSDLFSCCQDCGVCCQGLFCPCCLFGYNVIDVDRGNKNCCKECFWWSLCTIVCCGSCFGSKVRRDLRYKYHLQEEPCSDCCVHFLCPCCAVCQEARELKLRAAMPPIRESPGSYQPPVASDMGPQSHP